jgi:hypothetical protein
MSRASAWALSVVLLMAGWCGAAETGETAGTVETAASKMPASFVKITPADGDTFVFLGDSITAQGLYTQYLETYFYTRYPHLRLKFHNAGVSGDTAADALERLTSRSTCWCCWG